jgi:hypothetical protein
MDPLASPLDVQERLGRALTDTESLRVEALIRDASAKVRAVSTQQFTPGTTTGLELPISKTGRVRLPQRPVVSVEAVTDLNDNALTFTQVNEWLDVCLTPLNAWELHLPVGWRPAGVKVDYTHGGDVPDLIVGVVCAVVGRGLGNDPTSANTFQESIDGYSIGTSVTMAVALAQGGLLPSEIEICESFKRPGQPISTFA